MDNYISEQYLDEFEVDQIIKKDVVLHEYHPISEDSEEASAIGFSVILFLAQLVAMVIIQFGMIAWLRNKNEKMTKKMREILNDPNINVYSSQSMSGPNAFNAGTSSLYYTIELKKMLTEKELIAVLIHEYGHYHGKHTWKNLSAVTVGMTMLIAIQIILLRNWPLIAQLYAMILAQLGLNILIVRTLGRRFENYSDTYAAKKGYGKPLISALKKLGKFVEHKMCEGLNKKECELKMNQIHSIDSHPKTKDRIKNILKSSGTKKIFLSASADKIKMWALKVKNYI